MKISRRIAFCGINCGVAICTMLLSVFPYASVALSALAGIVLVPPALEIKSRFGWLCYAAVSLLCFLIVPDTSVKWMFVLFLGYYPLLQLRINLWYNRTLAWIVKLIVFNTACFAALFFVTYVLKINEAWHLIEEHPIALLGIPLLNVLFVVYDLALWRVVGFYRVRIHPFVSHFLR